MGYAIETNQLTKYYGKARGIGDIPDLALQGGALFVACHFQSPVDRFVGSGSGSTRELESSTAAST